MRWIFYKCGFKIHTAIEPIGFMFEFWFCDTLGTPIEDRRVWTEAELTTAVTTAGPKRTLEQFEGLIKECATNMLRDALQNGTINPSAR